MIRLSVRHQHFGSTPLPFITDELRSDSGSRVCVSSTGSCATCSPPGTWSGVQLWEESSRLSSDRCLECRRCDPPWLARRRDRTARWCRVLRVFWGDAGALHSHADRLRRTASRRVEAKGKRVGGVVGRGERVVPQVRTSAHVTRQRRPTVGRRLASGPGAAPSFPWCRALCWRRAWRWSSARRTRARARGRR